MRVGHAVLAAVVLLVGVAAVPAGGAQTADPPEPSMTVDLADDGDARVTVVSTFDFANESERAGFDALGRNETARSAYLARWTDKWRRLAVAAENRTEREMTVTNGSLALSRTNATGVASVSVTWTGLAAAQDGVLTLDEPFASDYTPDRRFVVVLPERYQLTSVSPGPSNASDGRLVYEPGTSLDGLSVAAATTPTPGNAASTVRRTADPVPTTGGTGPGFGVTAGLAGLLAAALVARRRG